MNFRTEFNKIPLEVELQWDGWRSRVYDLMHSGWEVEAIRGPDYDNMRLLLRNQELQLRGYSDAVNVVQWHQWYEHRDAPRSAIDGQFRHEQMIVAMKIAGNINIQVHGRIDAWRGLRSSPIEFAHFDGRELVVLDCLFSQRPKPDEIVVEKRPEVIDLLNQIKDIQNPRAKELLAAERKKGKVESFETSANIIAIR